MRKKQNIFSSFSKTKKIMFFGTIFITSLIIFPMVVLLAVGLLPTIVLMMTNNKDKTKLITVSCFNMASIFPFMFRLIDNFTTSEAIGIVTNVTSMILIYGASAVGLTIYNELPNIFSFIGKGNAKAKLESIDKNLEKMKEEWGEEIVVGVSQEHH